MKVTLEQIRAKSPCPEGWKKVKSYIEGSNIEQPFCVSEIIKSNDIDDTLWVLENVCGSDGELICHIFACDCAERVLPIFEKSYPEDDRPREAIRIKRLWARGEVDDAAGSAARAAARAAAWSAAGSAARAAAGSAARAVAWASARAAARAAA